MGSNFRKLPDDHIITNIKSQRITEEYVVTAFKSRRLTEDVESTALKSRRHAELYRASAFKNRRLNKTMNIRPSKHVNTLRSIGLQLSCWKIREDYKATNLKSLKLPD